MSAFGVIDSFTISSETMEFVLDAARLRDVDVAVIRRYIPNKIQAIKRVRDDCGIGLRDALVFVNGVFAAFDASRR